MSPQVVVGMDKEHAATTEVVPMEVEVVVEAIGGSSGSSELRAAAVGPSTHPSMAPLMNDQHEEAEMPLLAKKGRRSIKSKARTREDASDEDERQTVLEKIGKPMSKAERRSRLIVENEVLRKQVTTKQHRIAALLKESAEWTENKRMLIQDKEGSRAKLRHAREEQERLAVRVKTLDKEVKQREMTERQLNEVIAKMRAQQLEAGRQLRNSQGQLFEAQQELGRIKTEAAQRPRLSIHEYQERQRATTEATAKPSDPLISSFITTEATAKPSDPLISSFLTSESCGDLFDEEVLFLDDTGLPTTPEV